MIYIKKKKHIEDTLKLILVYGYCTNKKDGEIPLNQLAISRFLGLTRDSVVRQFKKIREMGMITITDRVKYTSNIQSKWFSNLYSIDKELINSYLIEKTGYDVLANITEESKMYYDFLLMVKETYHKKKLSKLSENEKELYKKKLAKKAQKDKERIEKLKSDNEQYTTLLKEVNNDIIPMSYLDENRRRLTSTLCVTKNPEVFGHEKDTVRMNMLEKFFNESKENITEYDTNASIYRLSYSLGNNKIASHKVDMYKLVFDECHFSNIEWNKELRNNFKKLLMPIYMLEKSIAYKSIQYKRHCKWKYFISKDTKADYLFYKYFVDTFKMDLKKFLFTVRDAMHKVFNLERFYQADIFIHESNLHIIMLKLFKDMGIKTINVYDGFYCISKEMNQQLYDEVYDKATSILIENLFNTKDSLEVA